MFFGPKKMTHQPGCLACHAVIAFILFCTSIFSIVGVVFAHYDGAHGVLIFGSNAGSLSLLSLAVSITLWGLQMKCLLGSCELCKKK